MLNLVILVEFSEIKILSRNLAKSADFKLKYGPPEGSKSGQKVVPAGMPRNPEMVKT